MFNLHRPTKEVSIAEQLGQTTENRAILAAKKDQEIKALGTRHDIRVVALGENATKRGLAALDPNKLSDDARRATEEHAIVATAIPGSATVQQHQPETGHVEEAPVGVHEVLAPQSQLPASNPQVPQRDPRTTT
jgi:hypothetical protein